MGTSSIDCSASPLLPSPLIATRTQEEICRVRQQDLNNWLRVVQHSIVQLEESSAGPERSVLLRQQTSGGAAIIEEEMHMSVPEMQEAIRSQREQICVLREQQQSVWALGLLEDPPPGYTLWKLICKFQGRHRHDIFSVMPAEKFASPVVL